MGIKTAREASGMTQAELAQALGVSQGAVANWENGSNGPTAGNLIKMSAILRCSVDDLLKRDVPRRG